MKNKKFNKCVLQLKDQINNSLEILHNLHLVRYFNPIEEEYISSEDIYRLSWKNHIGGRSVSSKSFLKIEQFMDILNNGAYHAILFDYSIIRVSFSFDGNNLISQNLLWWPCPVVIDFEDDEYDSYIEIVELFLLEKENFRMRSPIRVDLDITNDTPDHPKAHLHMQHHDSRINIESPICFNTFIKYIFNKCYPNIAIRSSDFPSMNLKLESKEVIEYVHKHKLYIHSSYK